MKKEKKFLDELRNKLGNISEKDKDVIVLKYSNIIKEHKDKNERIIDILKNIGSVDSVAEKEIEEYKKSNSFKYNMSNFFSKFKKNKDVKKKKENKKVVKKEEKAETKKLIKTKEVKEKKSFKDKFNEFKNKLNSNKKEKVVKEKNKKERKSFKDLFKKKEKTLKEEIVESIEDAKDEISEVTEIVTEKKVFETKEERNRRIFLKTIQVIGTTILIFILLWATVLFIASLFAYLDGVKFYGLIITLGGFDLLILSIIVLINKSLFNRKISRKWSFIFIILFILIIAFGVTLGVRQIYKLNITADVSEKYNMVKKNSSYNLPSDIDKKLYISFNTNYNTNYIIDYDNTINDKVNVEVKYYECYYDYYTKKDSNNLYISLRPDKRDRLSVYIDDFKEGKIYDNNELERYVVKITLNEKDKDRVVIK